MADNISVFDCDGHIIESIPEMVPFLDPVDRDIALKPTRNRQGVFAGLDAIHYPRNIQKSGEVEEPRRPRIDASDHRKGSGEDWVEFLNKAGVSESVLFPSEGLSVGFFQQADYAVRICHAFNDYVSEGLQVSALAWHTPTLSGKSTSPCCCETCGSTQI